MRKANPNSSPEPARAPKLFDILMCGATALTAEPDDPVIAANVRRLNDLLFAPLDYALVARTAAHA